MKHGRVPAWFAVLAAAGFAAMGSQDGVPPQPDRPADAARPGAERAGQDRAVVRARLQRRLEETRKAEERITQALERLEAGAPVEEVRDIADGPGRGGRGGRRPGGAGPEDGRRPDGPPPGAGPGVDRARIMGFLREQAPEVADRLEELRARNPEQFERLMGRMGTRVRELMAERDPRLKAARLAEFRHVQRVAESSRHLADLIRKGAPAEEIGKTRGELRALLGEQFDLRMERHQAEIGALEERLAKIRREAGDSASRREEIIQKGLERAEQRAREGDQRPDAPDPPGGR